MTKTYLTLDEIEAMDREMLTPAICAQYERCEAYAINLKAKAGRLEYPFVLSGNRVKIPKHAYVAFMRGKA